MQTLVSAEGLGSHPPRTLGTTVYEAKISLPNHRQQITSTFKLYVLTTLFLSRKNLASTSAVLRKSSFPAFLAGISVMYTTVCQIF